MIFMRVMSPRYNKNKIVLFIYQRNATYFINERTYLLVKSYCLIPGLTTKDALLPMTVDLRTNVRNP